MHEIQIAEIRMGDTPRPNWIYGDKSLSSKSVSLNLDFDKFVKCVAI